MNVLPSNEIVVVDVAGNVARIRCQDYTKSEVIRGLGFELTDDKSWSRNIESVDDRVSLISNLMIAGAIFSEGRDWSPAELVKFYKDKGYVAGNYRTISWSGPFQYQISECH